MKTLTRRSEQPDGQAAGPVRPPVSLPARPRNRARPALAGLSIAIIAVGGLGTLALFKAHSHTSPVLTLAHDVAQGTTITRDDLTVANLNADPALQVMPASQLSSVVGRTAVTNLLAGTTLSAGELTADPVPSKGQSVVGISLKPAQLPGEQLLAGDKVDIVTTPPQDADPPTTAPTPITAVVVSSAIDKTTGNTVVDVTIPAASAPLLAAEAATGRVALILDARAH